MSWKRFFMGEKMPDKADPKYKERYESEVNTGRKFARTLKIDKAAAAAQRIAIRHPRLFLFGVFGFVVCCFLYNVYRMCEIYSRVEKPRTATEMQDARLKERLKRQAATKEEQQESGYSREEVKAMEKQVYLLTHQTTGMSAEDSLEVKMLLDKLSKVDH